MFKAFFVILILIISMYVDHRIIDLRSFELANIKVEVKGNGATNGIYTLPKYSMLEDLLPMIALKDNADLSSYNRQQPLKD
ncbi:MAG: hypothetical protein MR210_09510, partial [Erysipelotrichaceae bacterium]|nr:hypothetical protein [Erysipelotrichaceae bacterium]